MIIVLIIISIFFLAYMFYRMQENTGLSTVIVSPIFYFSVLWFVAFPLHAYLLNSGWVDTQQTVVFTQQNLFVAVIVSMLALYLVWLGARPKYQNNHLVGVKLTTTLKEVTPRMILVVSVLMGLALLFLKVVFFSDGSWSPFVSNEQNEARVGKGPLFFLSELFLLGLIGVLPFILRFEFRSKNWIILVSVFILGFALSIIMGIALTSRRVIVVLLFALILGWIYRKPNGKSVLAMFLIVTTFVAAPFLQHLRYMMVATTYETQTSFCGIQEGQLTPQRSIVILNKDGELRRLSDTDNRIVRWLCGPSGYRSYLYIQNIASSFGLIDHLATYLSKASTKEILLGVDYGEAWSYNAILGWIPRVIWKDKPLQYGSVAVQKWLYPDLYKNTKVTFTLPPSFIVDFLFGFGIFVAGIILFWFGRFLSFVHELLLYRNDKFPVGFAFGIFVMCFLFNFIRAGTGMIPGVSTMIIVLVLMHGFASVRNNLLR